MAAGSDDGLEEHELEIFGHDTLDFDAWTKLISTAELVFKDDIDKISMVYDLFLSEFPLCYGYWKKYAEHKARLCNGDSVVQIFERAVESMPYSVGVWLDYCSFGIASIEDPLDICRLFERGLSFIGKDYLSHNFWDKYIEFEYSQQHWDSLANIYIRTLKFPTKKLHQYYESFKKLVAIWEEDIEFQDRSMQQNHEEDAEIMVGEDAQMSHLISDLHDASTRSEALLKYISIGEEFYRRSCDLDSKVKKFEENIRRPYFHAKSLDENQLQTWHQYLDFVELEGYFDWAVKLYERCLISCAHYPEFWMRYVDYLESRGGKELANDAMDRATQIFLKNAPEIHLFSAWFKEKAGDIDGAYGAFVMCGQDFGSHFIETVTRKANMEKRMGNYARASSVYKDALNVAARKRPDTLPMLYVHYARLQFAITSSLEAARTVLLNGIQRVPHSILLLKELIPFMSADDGAKQLDILDSIIAKSLTVDVAGALSTKDREEMSTLYLQLVDSCGSIHDIRRAWTRHLKLFPHSVRADSSLKKSVKAGDIFKMIAESTESINTCSQKSSLDIGENLTQLPQPEETLSVVEDVDKSEQATLRLTQSENGDMSQDGLELVPGEVTMSSGKDEGISDELTVGITYVTADGQNPELDCPNDIQRDQMHLSQQEKLLSQDSLSLGPTDNEVKTSVSRGVEAPGEASLTNGSTPTGVYETEEKLSKSSPTNLLENSAVDKCNESRKPSSAQGQKEYLPTLSPDHPSDREWNQLRRNSCGRARSDYESPRNSDERLERSLSPRRRGPHGYSGDRRRRERSLSPRRQGSRWRSDENWHRDRHHRRQPRYQDNSRAHRDGRMHNQSTAMVGNNGLPHNGQQKTVVSACQNKLPVQSAAYPQAPINQYPLPNNEQYGSVHGGQVYNQMWAHYYQQQQLLQQPTCQQQQPQQIPSHPQLLQQMQNPMQQHMTVHQQSLQIVPNQQQLLLMQYQQQQLAQQHDQQQQTNEQTQSQLQQQLHLQQLQLFQQPQSQQHDQQQPTSEQTQSQLQQVVQLQQLQLQVPQQQSYHNPQLVQQQIQVQHQQQQQQPQVQQQKAELQQQSEVYLQQQQQSYQYQQQYLLYLQQLHQYQQFQQQSGLVQDQKPFQKQLELPEKQQDQGEFPEVQKRNEIPLAQQDDGSLQVDPVGSHHHQDQGVETIHASTSRAAAELQSQDELPEIEGTDV